MTQASHCYFARTHNAQSQYGETRNEFAERIVCALIKYAKDETSFQQKDGKEVC